MNMWRKRTFWALLCLAPLLCAQAQQAPDPKATIRKKVDLVLVDVIVTDPKGTIVGGLRANDFELMDDGIPQELVHVSQDEIPLAIALVLDVSGSMDRVMKPMQNGIARALATLKAEDRVALFSFAEGYKLELGLTRDFNSIAKRIRWLGAEGGTNINQAIYFASDYIRGRAPQSRRVVILVSDMMASPSCCVFKTGKELERTLIQWEVAFFGIREWEVIPEGGNYGDMVNVDRLADESGGFVVNTHSPDGFQAAFEALIQILKTRYTLGFYPSTAGKPGSIRRLTVRLKNTEVQTALPNVVLRYRRQYVVPRDKAPKSR